VTPYSAVKRALDRAHDPLERQNRRKPIEDRVMHFLREDATDRRFTLKWHAASVGHNSIISLTVTYRGVKLYLHRVLGQIRTGKYARDEFIGWSLPKM
jgi:hypothetical protein